MTRFFYILSIILLSWQAAEASVIGAHTFAEHSNLSEGKWVKVCLDDEDDGVYEITYSELSKMGFSNPDNVGVFGFGGHSLDESFSQGHIDDIPEVATYHDSKNKRILFYAKGLIQWNYSKGKGFTHKRNTYATKAYYFLHEKDTSSLQMEETYNTATSSGNGSEDISGSRSENENGSKTASVDTVSAFDAHLLHETESVNLGTTGRELYGESFIYNQSQTFSFNQQLLPCKAVVTVNFVASSSSSSSLSVKETNCDFTCSGSISGNNTEYVFATETTIRDTINYESATYPSFRLIYNSGTSSAKTANLNYIEVQGKMPIELESSSSYLLFRNAEAATKTLTYDISANTGNIQVWDVTSDSPKLVTLNSGYFTAEEQGIKEYALVDLDGKHFPGIKSYEDVANQDLHNMEEADMVIVTPSGFKYYAQELADYRTSHDNLKVIVATIEQIYNEYSSGTADATAIRLYMKQFYDRYQSGSYSKNLKYLLLFGDGYYNNRKIEDSNYYLPSYETEYSLVETSSTVCDDYFGFLDDNEGGKTDSYGRYSISDDVLDIGIGRLPVHTVSEAEAVLNKIEQYSGNYHYGAWKNKLCFLSDDDKISDSATDSPNEHMIHNENVINILQKELGHKEFLYQKIYLPAYTQTTSSSGTDYPDARKEFSEVLQQGALLINFAGHGSSTSITHENLMTTAKASELNMKNLPMWITASCDISRWDNDETSMGEALLLNGNGGAIALISTVRVVFAQQNQQLNLAIARNLFNRNSDGSRYRLGDIIKAAKVSLGSDYNKLNFCLLGDPSMTLAYPEYKMEITNVDTEQNTITMSGRVIDPGTGETATDFNGLVYPTIYGSEDTITADKGLCQEPYYKFAVRKNKIFSGRDAISEGLFKFSFDVPLDAVGNNNSCLVNLYSCSDNIEEGQGYCDDVIIPSAKNDTSDTTGPEIRKIFLNSSVFKDGDVVGSTPYFFAEVHDDSGFNATGNKIGHDVALTIKSTSNSLLDSKQYILNNYLTTYTGDSHTGNIRYSIPQLEDGEYDATFKIWDSYNNSSSKTIHFTVKASQKYQPVQIQAYPSPISTGETVTFRILHNLPESPTTVRLQIYTQTGIKVIEKSLTSSSSEIYYSSNDESSDFYGCTTIKWTASVIPGVYIYRVYLSSDGSEDASDSKLLMVK